MTKFGLVRAALNTTISTQQFRDANLTETPNFAIFIVSGATANATATDHARIGIGAADGTNQFAIATTSEHGLSASDSFRRSKDNQCVMLLDTGSDSVDGEADFNAWLSDSGSGAGVEIDITDAFASGYLLTVLLFNFDNVDVGTFVEPTTSVNVSTGFQPNIFITFGAAHAIPANNPHLNLAIGISVDDSGIVKRSLGVKDRDNVGTTLAGGHISNDNSHVIFNNTGTTLSRSHSVTAFNATTVTVTNDSGSPTTQEIGYIAINTSDDFKLLDVPSETSIGSDAVTGVGFSADLGLGVLSQIDTYNTDKNNEQAGSFALGAFTENDEYSTAIAFEDAAGTTNTESWSDSNHASIKEDDGTQRFRASITSIDSDGWTRNIATADATARQNFWLLFGEAAASGLSIPVAMSNYRMRRVANVS